MGSGGERGMVEELAGLGLVGWDAWGRGGCLLSSWLVRPSEMVVSGGRVGRWLCSWVAGSVRSTYNNEMDDDDLDRGRHLVSFVYASP